VNRINVVLACAAVLVAGYAAPSRAGGINLSGPHYNLNIIGVENPKTDPMTGGDRHTIFVALGSKTSSVTSRIYLTPGPFAVCDGNAFDAATACDGSIVAQQGAVFHCLATPPSRLTQAVPMADCPIRSGRAPWARRAALRP